MRREEEEELREQIEKELILEGYIGAELEERIEETLRETRAPRPELTVGERQR